MQRWAIYKGNERVGVKVFDGYTRREIYRKLRETFNLRYVRNVFIVPVKW